MIHPWFFHSVMVLELSNTFVRHVQVQVQCLNQLLIDLILNLTLDLLLDAVDGGLIDA